jgi:hypothetical protein
VEKENRNQEAEFRSCKIGGYLFGLEEFKAYVSKVPYRWLIKSNLLSIHILP